MKINKLFIALSFILSMALSSCGKVNEKVTVNDNNLELISFGVNKESTRQQYQKTPLKSYSQKEQDIFINEQEDIQLLAQVKNLDRLSFVDIVVYSEAIGTSCVFNEGNGEYLCSSTTVLRNDMWITDIVLNVNYSLINLKTDNCLDTKYIEIKEISFLRHDGNFAKPDLSNCSISKVSFAYDDIKNTEYHNWGEWEYLTAPACEEEGEEIRYCIDNHNHYQVRPVSPTDHNWGEWEYLTAPTCLETGERIRYCLNDRNHFETEIVDPLGHDWYTDNPCACGFVTMKCSRCNELYEGYRYDGHSWGEEELVNAPDESYVSYIKQYCQLDNKERIVIGAFDGVLSEDSQISTNSYSPPEGYLRFENYGQITYKFNYSKATVGEIYLKGCVNSVSFASSSFYPNGRDEGNFILTVNNEIVDYSSLKGVPYSSLLSTYNEEWDLGERSDSFSNVGIVKIGEISLKDGENIISYERTASYSFYFSQIILIVDSITHEHNFSSYGYSDSHHWKICSDIDCPNKGIKSDYEEHALVESVISESDCCVDGLKSFDCECGYHAEEIIEAAHTYEIAKTINNSNGQEIKIYQCSVCGKEFESIDFADFYGGSITNGKIRNGDTLQWLVPITRVAKMSVYFPMKYGTSWSSEVYNQQTFDPTKYVFSVNDHPCECLLNGSTYQDVGFSSENKHFKVFEYDITQEDVDNGKIITAEEEFLQVTIAFTHLQNAYRLLFLGEMHIFFE